MWPPIRVPTIGHIKKACFDRNVNNNDKQIFSIAEAVLRKNASKDISTNKQR